MAVLSNKLFSRNHTTAANIGYLARRSSSLYSTSGGATTCSVLRRGAVTSLATVASLPLSWRVTRMQKLSTINATIKDIIMGSDKVASKTEEERFKKLVKAKEKTAKIQVYVQDISAGPNPTVFEVARSSAVQAANSSVMFSLVKVVDDLLTAGADPNSETLGRAQGLITFSDMNEMAIIMNLTYYFTEGEFKGSSLCICGRNPINNKDRELAIVGGTGVFRMARGYAITTTQSFDADTNDGVLEYTFYVAYPDQ